MRATLLTLPILALCSACPVPKDEQPTNDDAAGETGPPPSPKPGAETETGGAGSSSCEEDLERVEAERDRALADLDACKAGAK
jgi:hypothetical protein